MAEPASPRPSQSGMDSQQERELLDVEGRLAESAAGLLNAGQIAEAMRLMLLSRAIDERVTKLHRLSRAGTYGPVHGQEAAVVGSAMALDPARDWIVPASREQPAMVRHGLSLDRLLAGYMGKLDFSRIPDSVNLLPRNQSIASQLPHAVGLAWALKLRRYRGVVLVYFGDGASSEGDFHEAANLAGVQQVPLVFLLINNRYAISTPVSKQTAAPSLAARAEGYGFPGMAVDGNDLFAVHSATVDAVELALKGDGPTLIEARTYRMGFHNTSDNPKEYRDDAEVEAAAKLDPIERIRRYATRLGIWSEGIEAEMVAAIATELDNAYRAVAALPRAGRNEVFEHVYETLPARVAQQRDKTLSEQ
ncbi:MAG: thiamine pyrophosphate-dependent enzyme [Candidatus Dormibacteraceae bacterium]